MNRFPLILLVLLGIVGCASQQANSSLPKALSSESPASVPVLLGLDPVRQDLHLSSLQCALLDSLRSEYKSRSRQITAIGMADREAALRSDWDLQNLRNNYNKRALAVLSPSQQDRLRQIERQMLGGSLLTSPTEQRLLGLSASQQKSISAISASDRSNASAINALFNSGIISPFERDIRLHRNQRQTSRQMLAVLNPDQRKHWLVLSGQKLGLLEIHDRNASAKSLFEGS